MTKFIEVLAPWIKPMAIPSTAIKSIEKNDDGTATIFFNSDYSVKHPKGGYFGSILSVKSYDHVMATLNHTPPEPLILDLSKAEQDKIRRTLNATQQTLDSIPKMSDKVWLQPGVEYDRDYLRDQFVRLQNINEDVGRAVALLSDGEYAEHWAVSSPGKRLEQELTKLVGSENEKANRLLRAEELLAEVWHEWNNDDATRKALGDDMGNVIGSFLYPGRTNC